MSSGSELEVVDDPPFNLALWIGQGRKYPENPGEVPLRLHHYFDALSAIPDDIKDHAIPSPLLNVNAFLNWKPPKQDFGLTFVNPQQCFHGAEPNNGHLLAEQPIPPITWVKELKKNFLQAILDGLLSITVPKYPGSFYPLWSINYWLTMHETHEVWKGWKEGVEWIERGLESDESEETREMLKKAKTYIQILRWREKTLIPGADGTETSTYAFASYLSNNKLMGTDHLNMMFSFLSDRAESDEDTDLLVVIERLRFMKALEKVAGKTGRSDKFLKSLEGRVEKGDILALIFPVYMDQERHWIAIRIDFEKEEIACGDSLAHRGMKEPRVAIKLIQNWLKKRFDMKFKFTGDSLPHGDQEDFTDCGILAVNTAAHDVFGDSLWSPSKKTLERAAWFVRLTSAHIKDVDSSESQTPYPNISEESTLSKPMDIAHLLNPTPLSDELQLPISSTPQVPDTSPIPSFEGVDERVVTASNQLTEVGTGKPNGPTKEKGKGKMVVGEKKEKRRRETVSEDAPRKMTKTEQEVAALYPNLADRPINRTSLWSRLQNRKFKDGIFSGSMKRDTEFKVKIQAIDPHATIKSPKVVRHFKCGKDLQMKNPYNIEYFETHAKGCQGPPKSHKHPTGGMKENPLDGFFKVSQNVSRKPKPCEQIPCPGLRRTVYPPVDTYLERTGALGGGGQSVSSLAREFFGKRYRFLSTRRKQHVRNAQTHSWMWRNDHQNGVVYSTECTKVATTRTVSDSSTNKQKVVDVPCHECEAILSKKMFKNAVRVPQPPDERYKYLNIKYRNENLAIIYGRSTGLRGIMEDTTHGPLVRYCKGVITGEYRGDDLFGGLLQAVVVKREKELRGVGMQNFRYTPDLVEFAHVVHTHSARAYNALKEFFPLPDPRTLKLHRSKQPRFPCGIHDRTFDFAIQKLSQLQYNGPIALSCDDTKLLASLRPYYDHDREGYYLMGHVGEPVALLNHETFRAIVEAQKLQKATKLRLWCIQVPLAKIPTIIVAAVAIPENLTAQDLLVHLWEIISGFLDRNIKISSYASDGSNVERSVQRLLEERASSVTQVSVKHPHDLSGASDYSINIPFYGTQPIAIIQDPKHLLKTFRNNLFSGARLLTFPTGVATFSQVRRITMSQDSPIYVRDVEKADRQDDNAAARLFSGATLEWLKDNHPEDLGLIIYLFVFGELIDAYQNRFLALVDRVVLVLRAHYFNEMWEKFLTLSKYPKSRHYVSPQCADITRTLIQGFLQALIIYRDFSGSQVHPFLPWLLSTEVIEHVFGLCRQIIKDFTMLDFHEMVPKLFVQLRQATLSSKFNNGKATASGYNHTYTDTRGINIQALSTYPSNSEINDAAVRAYGEAESLFAMLNITAADLYYHDRAPPLRLPGIASWFQDTSFLFDDLDELADNDDSHDYEEGSNSEDVEYQEMMDVLEDADDDLPVASAQKLMNYRYASIALSLEDRQKIALLADLDDDGTEEAFAEDASQIASQLSMCAEKKAVLLPPINGHPIGNPFDSVDPSSIDLSSLTTLRFAHQTKQAENGVRTSKSRHKANVSQDETSDLEARTHPKPLTDRQQILRGFAEIIREQGEKGIGTGLDRAARWRNPAPGGREAEVIDGLSAPELAGGNSANAAAVADAAAKKALTRRKTIIKKAGLPNILGEARVNSLRPLCVGDFGIAISPTLNKLVVCKVITLYSKTTGKGSRHCSVTDSSNIMALSNVAIQVFEHQLGTLFRIIPHTQLLPGVHRFDLIPPSAFLCTLSVSPKQTHIDVKISLSDWNLFQEMQRHGENISKAIKLLSGRKKAAEDEE